METILSNGDTKANHNEQFTLHVTEALENTHMMPSRTESVGLIYIFLAVASSLEQARTS